MGWEAILTFLLQSGLIQMAIDLIKYLIGVFTKTGNVAQMQRLHAVISKQTPEVQSQIYGGVVDLSIIPTPPVTGT